MGKTAASPIPGGRPSGDIDRETVGRVVVALVAVAMVGAAFATSVAVRRPYLGDSGDLGSILQWTLQWYEEGPLALRFGLLDHFAAIETPTLVERRGYASYPAGTIVLPWFAATVLHTDPTPAFISWVNMLSQLVLAVTMGLIAAIFAARFRWPAVLCGLAAILASLTVLLSRGPLYYFMITHVHDVAVLPWVALFLLAEMLRPGQRGRRRVWLDGCQQLAAFLGAFTDWFFFFVLASALAGRFWLGQFAGRSPGRVARELALFGSGAMAAMAVYVYSVTALGRWPQVFARGLARTGLEAGESPIARLSVTFWQAALPWNFNAIGADAIWWTYAAVAGLTIALVIRAGRRRSFSWLRPETRVLLAFVLVLLVAPLAQVYFFSDHTANHHWSGLKFVLVLGLVTFTLGPLLVVEAVRDMGASLLTLRTLACLIAAVQVYLIVAFGSLAAKTMTANFQFQAPSFRAQEIGETLRRYARPSDILVSPQFGVWPKSVAFSFSRRVVYLAPDPGLVRFISWCFVVPHDVLIVTSGPASPAWDAELARAAPLAVAAGLTFTRLPSEDLLDGVLPPYDQVQCADAGLRRSGIARVTTAPGRGRPEAASPVQRGPQRPGAKAPERI